MAMLYFLRNTPREVIEATLLVKVSAKLVYHMVCPHQLKRTTKLQLQCVNTWCDGENGAGGETRIVFLGDIIVN